MTEKLQNALVAVRESAAALPGDVCIYFESLESGESFAYNADTPVIAASVIKLAVMVEFYCRMDAGQLDPNAPIVIHKDEKLPSCGALTYLHDGLTVTAEDLCTLMIILSDNTATNILIRLLGMDAINARVDGLGLDGIRMTRLLFDAEASARGLENRITARAVGRLLKMIYEKKLPRSETMLKTLLDQRLNGKIPFFIHREVPIAHKTGEDDGITHDAAIVLGEHPFILCICSEKTDTPCCNRFMQDAARILLRAVNC